jgi:hypothetical protein
MITKQLTFAMLLCSIGFTQEQPAQLKLAVMGIKAEAGVSQQIIGPAMEIISAEVTKLNKYKVINQADIRAMLEHLGNKQLLECDETKCLTIIGGALGVDHILSGSVGKVGATYLISLKVIDIDKADVLSRLNVEYRGSEEGLIEKIKYAVVKLFDEKRLFYKKLTKWSVVGTAVAAAGAGGYFAWQGNDVYENKFRTAVGYDNAVRYKSEFEKKDLYRNISLAVTGALSSAAIYLFWKD